MNLVPGKRSPVASNLQGKLVLKESDRPNPAASKAAFRDFVEMARRGVNVGRLEKVVAGMQCDVNGTATENSPGS